MYLVYFYNENSYLWEVLQIPKQKIAIGIDLEDEIPVSFNLLTPLWELKEQMTSQNQTIFDLIDKLEDTLSDLDYVIENGSLNNLGILLKYIESCGKLRETTQKLLYDYLTNKLFYLAGIHTFFGDYLEGKAKLFITKNEIKKDCETEGYTYYPIVEILKKALNTP